jgi:hypothetical protein
LIRAFSGAESLDISGLFWLFDICILLLQRKKPRICRGFCDDDD